MSILYAYTQIFTRYTNIDEIKARKYYNLTSKATIISLPPVDVGSLLLEDSINRSQIKPFRFGYPIPVKIGFDNSGDF